MCSAPESDRPALFLGLLVAILATPAAAGEGGEWVDLASMELPRQETGAARIGGRVYVVGGLIGFGTARDSVEVYDIAQDRWSFAAPLPEPRDHMGVAAVDGKLYVSGGYAGDFDARDELFIYDSATDSWSEGARMPEARGAHWMAAHGGELFLFGGVDRSDRPRAETFIYDPDSDSWRRGADLPTPREHLNAVVVGDFIYVLGGRAGRAFNRNERYDPARDTWTSLAPMPTARSAMAAGALDGKIYAMGGEIPRLFAVNEVYDVATDTWDSAAPMPLPRHGVAAVALEDRILVPAGGTIQGLAPTSRMDAFLPRGASPGRLELDTDVFPAGEEGGAATVTVSRSGGNSGAVSVEYATENLSATAGPDYAAAVGTLEWADGEGGARSFTVPLVDDTDPERTELVRVRLTGITGDTEPGRDTAVVAIRDDDGAGGCTEETPEGVAGGSLCLVGEGRFRVEAEWRDPRSGDSGLANVIPESQTTGFFWFFAPSNVELIVKMLDGRDLTGAFWVFYGALSDVEYWISVTDTESGAFRVFHNPPFELASFADTSAFPVPPEDSVIAGSVAGARAPSSRSAIGTGESSGTGAACVPDAETLCLGPDGRFRVTVSWAEPGGDSGLGQAERRSEESGTFWFFSPDNLELVVKLLDGRPVNGHFWFFSGALSNVEYRITVTDTGTGETREYLNEQGTLRSRADTEAFDG